MSKPHWMVKLFGAIECARGNINCAGCYENQNQIIIPYALVMNNSDAIVGLHFTDLAQVGVG